MTHSGFVLGVDGCRQGWVGVVLPVEEAAGDPARGVAARPWPLAEDAGPVAGVGVDMPLHLTDDPWPRPADVAAGHLGPRGATLFVTPPASAYEAADYAAGCDVARERTGSASAGRLGPAGEGAGAGGVAKARGRPGAGGPPGGVVLAARRRRDPAAEVRPAGGPPRRARRRGDRRARRPGRGGPPRRPRRRARRRRRGLDHPPARGRHGPLVPLTASSSSPAVAGRRSGPGAVTRGWGTGWCAPSCRPGCCTRCRTGPGRPAGRGGGPGSRQARSAASSAKVAMVTRSPSSATKDLTSTKPGMAVARRTISAAVSA